MRYKLLIGTKHPVVAYYRKSICIFDDISNEICHTVFTGDSVILGKTQMFRFNNPEEAALLRDKRAVRIRNVFKY
jgi:hypothetical protein